MIKTLINILEGAILNIGEIIQFFGEKQWLFVSFVGGVVYSFFTKYIFGDVGLLPWLGLIILLDTIAGYRAASRMHKENPVLNTKPSGQRLREKLASKLISYVIALVSLNAITRFEIEGKPAQETLSEIEIFGGLNLNFLKIIYHMAVMGFMFFELRSIHRNLKVTGFNFLNSRAVDQIDNLIGKEDGDNH